jgi:hypothetical protein
MARLSPFLKRKKNYKNYIMRGKKLQEPPNRKKALTGKLAHHGFS